MISIDPSLTCTGIAVHDGDNIVTEAIKPKHRRGICRLQYIRDMICLRLDRYSPEAAIVENYSYGSKGRALFDIGELGGVLKTAVHEYGIPIVLVPPTVLKMYAVGKGNADKNDVADAISSKWSVQFNTTDEADAYALLRLGEAYYNPRKRRALPQKVATSIVACPLAE